MIFSFSKLRMALTGSMLLVMILGCHNFYKATRVNLNGNMSKKIDSLQEEKRYFILRDGDNAYYMNDVSLSEDGSTLRCTLDSLPENHRLHLTHGRNGNMRYKGLQPADVGVLNEVHVFIKSSDSVHAGPLTLNLDQIQKLEVIKKDKGRTTTSYILGGLAITTGAIAVVGIIAAATYTPEPVYISPGTCSPQVYTMTNNNKVLNGTLCSGAIYASLKRTDYLPVNVIEENSAELNLILNGEKNEELMMNDFKLMQVTHSTEEKILVDKNGIALAYKNPVAPEHAFIGQNKDVLNDINATDEKYYSFTNESNDGSSNVVLDFKKPIDASSAKLIIRGKNSNWAYYVFNEFKKLYGNRYQSLILKKDKANPSAVLQCSIDQSLPLLVSVKNGKDWKQVDYFFAPGNAASRDMIMQLDLHDFKDKDHIEIKLQTVYRFWDIDYAAIDFSDDQPTSVSYLMPTEFYKSGVVSQTVQFAKNDTSCLHIRGGEQLHITFKIDENADGTERTYFLQGDGYYHDNTVFTEKPKLTELLKCTGKGAFDKFSRRKFREALAGVNHQQNNDGKDFEVLK